MQLSTPALLFPTVTLLLLAYTNRFLALAALVRDLHSKYRNTHEPIIAKQLKNLRRRIRLIRDMQGVGVASLLLCVVCMFVLFAGMERLGEALFGLSLVLMAISLGLSLVEIRISTDALEMHLSDVEHEEETLSMRRPESKR